MFPDFLELMIAKFKVFLMFCLAVFLVFSPAIQAKDGVVCREYGIKGMDASKQRALKFVLAKAIRADQASVYIEKVDDGYYFHSNFHSRDPESPEKYSEYPTKIFVKEDTFKKYDATFAQMYEKIISWSGDPLETVQADQALKNVHVYLDTSMIDDNGIPLISLAEVNPKNITFVDGSTGKNYSSIMEIITTEIPPPIIAGKINECCFLGVPPHLASGFREKLSEIKFSADNFAFLSFENDSRTLEAIKNSKEIKKADLGLRPPPHTIAQLEKAFERAAGKRMILVGHFADGGFLIRDAQGNIQANFNIFKVRELAQKHNVELIDLGCKTINTAKNGKIKDIGIGVAVEFGSEKAVRLLEKALDNSSNYAEFFENLTSTGLKVVVTSKFVEKSEIHAKIYERSKTTMLFNKVADLVITLRNKVAA